MTTEKLNQIVAILLDGNGKASHLFHNDAEFRSDLLKLVHMLEPCLEWFVITAEERRRQTKLYELYSQGLGRFVAGTGKQSYGSLMRQLEHDSEKES